MAKKIWGMNKGKDEVRMRYLKPGSGKAKKLKSWEPAMGKTRLGLNYLCWLAGLNASSDFVCFFIFHIMHFLKPMKFSSNQTNVTQDLTKG